MKSTDLAGVSSPKAGVATAPASAEDLLRRTLRMVAILVAACVLFTGGLSLLAVAVTSHAVAASGPAADVDEPAREVAPNTGRQVDAPTKADPAKKPLSI